PISLVDKLFTLRTKIFALIYPRAIWRAPVLFLMALFVWCLGFAMIYPPRALSVTLHPWRSNRDMKLSVMNPTVEREFNPMLETGWDLPSLSLYQAASTVQLDKLTLCREPQVAVVNLAKAYLWTGQMSALPLPPAENSTYELEFDGPQLQCNSTAYNTTILSRNIAEWDEKACGGRTRREGYDYDYFCDAWLKISEYERVLTIEKKKILRVYREEKALDNKTSSAIVNVNTTTCSSISASYKVTIAYDRGIRSIQYALSNSHPYQIPRNRSESTYTWTGERWPWNATKDGTQSYPPALRTWINEQATYLRLYSEFAVLDSFLARVRTNWDSAIYHPATNCTEPSAFNGTAILLCNGAPKGLGANAATSTPYFKETSAAPSLRGTVFDKSRNERMKNQTNVLAAYVGMWDPRSKLDVSEKTLNAALSNITISALTQGTWRGDVSVRTTRYQSTYVFLHRVNMIVPYSVCLVVAFVFGLVAMWSLWRNGVAATDGGFLQVMMATRGSTEMERLVLKEGPVATDQVSEELKRLRARYGELVIGGEAEGVKRVGFGSSGETIELRKRR
ncbi:hypothetical protein CC86DRAFT_298749, partial [Ophiobolus disseminans]